MNPYTEILLISACLSFLLALALPLDWETEALKFRIKRFLHLFNFPTWQNRGSAHGYGDYCVFCGDVRKDSWECKGPFETATEHPHTKGTHNPKSLIEFTVKTDGQYAAWSKWYDQNRRNRIANKAKQTGNLC